MSKLRGLMLTSSSAFLLGGPRVSCMQTNGAGPEATIRKDLASGGKFTCRTLSSVAPSGQCAYSEVMASMVSTSFGVCTVF